MAKLCMLTERSPFMMSFVFITDRQRCIVIDGGNPEDMPYLWDMVGDRKIAAWILTHPHFDHISGFVQAMEQDTAPDQIETIYYNFPSQEFVLTCEPHIQPCSILDFNRVLPKFRHKTVLAEPGMKLRIDELEVEFLFAGGERFPEPIRELAVNESSIVFRVTGPNLRSVLFLGDLGPTGGKALLAQSPEKLPSHIVQMSHHGHSGVTKEVYQKIAPQACLWCAPDWLWEEADVSFGPEIWGTKHTRKWMDELNITEHYISKDGDQWIPLAL